MEILMRRSKLHCIMAKLSIVRGQAANCGNVTRITYGGRKIVQAFCVYFVAQSRTYRPPPRGSMPQYDAPVCALQTRAGRQ